MYSTAVGFFYIYFIKKQKEIDGQSQNNNKKFFLANFLQMLQFLRIRILQKVKKMCSYEENFFSSKYSMWVKRKIYADFKFIEVFLKNL